MASTVAVLSDIHGVAPVLDAVLAEADVTSADLIVVTGDHLAGPQPIPVLRRLQALGDRVVLVRGNADRELVSLARGESLASGEPWPVDAWAAAQLAPADVEFLDSLPHPVTVQIDGFGPVLFCHGTPSNDEETVLVDTRLERWAEVFGNLTDDVQTVVCGHTHMPFARLVNRRLVINSGSIGMPYGRPGGQWALLHAGDVTLRRTSVDVDAAIAELVVGSDYPDARAWAEDYLTASASDALALANFAPRDGRAI